MNTIFIFKTDIHHPRILVLRCILSTGDSADIPPEVRLHSTLCLRLGGGGYRCRCRCEAGCLDQVT